MTLYKYSELDSMYGEFNYENKIVLDVGADYGSTAYYFLSRGARFVLCSEMDKDRQEALLAIAKCNLRIVPMPCIYRPKILNDIISVFKPDVVKMDCEGCEKNILDARFYDVKKWVLETHGHDIHNRIKEAFKEKKFTTKEFPVGKDTRILYAEADI